MTAVSAETRDLQRLRLALKVLDKESKKAVNKTLRSAVEPIREEFRVEVDATIPRRGGLAAAMKKSRFAVVKRLGGSRPTLNIRIRRLKRAHLAIINEGRLRHPVFGAPGKTRKQWRWVDQTVRAGLWDRTLDKAVPEVEVALRQSVKDAVQATVRAAARG